MPDTSDKTGVKKSSRDQLFEHTLSDMQYRHKFSNEACDAVTEFYESGNLDSYLSGGIGISPYLVVYLGPDPTLETVIERFKAYWDWVLQDIENRRDIYDKKFDSLDSQLIAPFDALFNERYGNYFSAELIAALFQWLHGEQYDPKRKFPLSLGPNDWRPEIPPAIEERGTQLMMGIDDYLFGYNNDDYHNPAHFALLMDYFVSILPVLNRECFSSKLADRFHKVDGVASGLRAYQLRTRNFLAHINQIATSRNIRDGHETLPMNDSEALEALRAALAAASLPKHYYLLQDFVVRHGAECCEVSE